MIMWQDQIKTKALIPGQELLIKIINFRRIICIITTNVTIINMHQIMKMKLWRLCYTRVLEHSVIVKNHDEYNKICVYEIIWRP